MLGSEDILFFAAGTMQDSEAATIRQRGLACIGFAEAQADPGAAARPAVEWARRFECVLVHLDADVLDFVAFLIAENTRRDLGLTLDELDTVLLELLPMPTWRVLTVAEVNPDHAPDDAATFARLNAMLTRALGDRSTSPITGPTTPGQRGEAAFAHRCGVAPPALRAVARAGQEGVDRGGADALDRHSPLAARPK